MALSFVGFDGQCVLGRRLFDNRQKEFAVGIATPTPGNLQGRPLTSIDDTALRDYQINHFDMKTTSNLHLAKICLPDQGIFWVCSMVTVNSAG
ncbi:uncharacterized protein N7503_007732 [Penicillium pulvis]|uniref:uncharacterized protein n=1 Tax=Penicillium pulvis TaxID=1562058 RepID=UPI002547A174|nr:uncharacterized protein N7503_007732 [Penicillium pulvis]KAJ5798436.1 hypothetical protein N7503_007732 [Penicillium pulvis]